MKKQKSVSGMYPDKPKTAVGAVVFKDNAVLLVKRGKPPGKGFWAIPGGSIHLGEGLQSAAEREIGEETGLLIKAGEPIFIFDVIEKDADGTVKYHYVIVDLMAEYISGELEPGDDAEDARWVEQKDLAMLDINPVTLKLLAEKFNFGSNWE